MDTNDQELKRLAEEMGVDLDVLDESMRKIAAKEEGSIERALLLSNVSVETRLRIGLLTIGYIQATKELGELRGDLMLDFLESVQAERRPDN
jgi:hypothetical protein